MTAFSNIILSLVIKEYMSDGTVKTVNFVYYYCIVFSNNKTNIVKSYIVGGTVCDHGDHGHIIA